MGILCNSIDIYRIEQYEIPSRVLNHHLIYCRSDIASKRDREMDGHGHSDLTDRMQWNYKYSSDEYTDISPGNTKTRDVLKQLSKHVASWSSLLRYPSFIWHDIIYTYIYLSIYQIIKSQCQTRSHTHGQTVVCLLWVFYTHITSEAMGYWWNTHKK